MLKVVVACSSDAASWDEADAHTTTPYADHCRPLVSPCRCYDSTAITSGQGSSFVSLLG